MDLYDEAMGVKPRPHYKKKKESHGKHYKDALATVPEEGPTDYNSALELMADAAIAYKSKTGMPHSSDPEHRHFVVREIEELILQRFMEQAGGDRGKAAQMARQELLSGNFHDILNGVLMQYNAQSVNGDIRYEIQKLIPSDDDAKRREAAEKYAKRHPTDYDQGDIEMLASPANYDKLLDLLVADFDKLAKKKAGKSSGLEKKVKKAA